MLISLKNGNTIEVEISWWLSLSDNDQDDFLSNAEMYFYGTEDIDNPFFKSAVEFEEIESHVPHVQNKHFTLDEEDSENDESDEEDDNILPNTED